jgi:hypothetical protein
LQRRNSVQATISDESKDEVHEGKEESDCASDLTPTDNIYDEEDTDNMFDDED